MIRHVLCCVLALTCHFAIAAPGAHGPNGEHLETPATQTETGPGAPRLEAASETFELLGRLYDDEFSIVIDRFESNEPVAHAKVEAEANGVKAEAKFHADHGDYAFTEPAFLKALREPGDHAVVFTILAGRQSDLLEGTLQIAPTQVFGNAHGHSDHAHDDGHNHEHGDDHAHEYDWQKPAMIIGVFLLLTIVGLLLRRRASTKQK